MDRDDPDHQSYKSESGNLTSIRWSDHTMDLHISLSTAVTGIIESDKKVNDKSVTFISHNVVTEHNLM